MEKLANKKHERFCQEWLIDLNATQAATRAGYSKNTANEQGARLLTYAGIQARIAYLTEERAKRVQVTQDDVINELKKIAFSNILDFMHVNAQVVSVLDTSEMPPDKVGAIAQIKETKEGVTLKLYGKVDALRLLGKHLGMFGDEDDRQLRREEMEMRNF